MNSNQNIIVEIQNVPRKQIRALLKFGQNINLINELASQASSDKAEQRGMFKIFIKAIIALRTQPNTSDHDMDFRFKVHMVSINEMLLLKKALQQHNIYSIKKQIGSAIYEPFTIVAMKLRNAISIAIDNPNGSPDANLFNPNELPFIDPEQV